MANTSACHHHIDQLKLVDFTPRSAAQGMARKGGIIPHRLRATRAATPHPTRVATGFPSIPAMPLTPSDISTIANLARLELAPDESERMLTQLNGFFDIVQKMRAVKTAGMLPLAHPFATIGDIALRLRDDVVSESDNREANQRSAPKVEDGLFLVPQVIE